MAEIKSFKGIRYAGRNGAELAAVLAPPYDVITPEAQRLLYESDPCNVIRLILGKDLPGDNESDNRYSRAAGFFSDWLAEGVLRADDRPSLYVYEQTYTLPGIGPRTRRGLIGAVRLVDFSQGIVLPHEETFARHKEDRLRLMRACGANFSPVFGLYSEPQGRIDEVLSLTVQGRPLAAADNDEGRHLLWSITDPIQQGVITAAMADRQIFIADGHHRYETALNYSRELRRERGLGDKGDYAFDYVMMVMVETSDPGLTILPTHRLVVRGSMPSREKLEACFTIAELRGGREDLTAQLADAGQKGPSFAIYADGKVQILTLRPGAMTASGPRAALDVTILHELLLKSLMEIDDTDPSSISFTVDAGEAFDAVDNGRAVMAVMLNPTPIEQVRQVALAGERMPRKSTYFYPKLITGLVINKLL